MHVLAFCIYETIQLQKKKLQIQLSHFQLLVLSSMKCDVCYRLNICTLCPLKMKAEKKKESGGFSFLAAQESETTCN